MTYYQLKKHYGTAGKACAAVGLTAPRATVWRKKGVPINYQCQFELLTRGKLRADRKLLKETAI